MIRTILRSPLVSVVRWHGQRACHSTIVNTTSTVSYRSASQVSVPPQQNKSFSMLLLTAATGLMACGAMDKDPPAQTEAIPDSKGEKLIPYAAVVDLLRDRIADFRNTLKSTESRIPKSFPIQKVGISRVHAPNGVSTIRVEFVCPPFVDSEAILARFLSSLQHSTTSIEVVASTLQQHKDDKKSIVEHHDQPSLQYLYANGHGSFHFIRDTSIQGNQGSTFVFYKDDAMNMQEVEAIVNAYKEMYSIPNVHAYFKYDRDQLRRKMRLGGSKQSLADVGPTNTKDEAVQQLQSLGIDVFESSNDDDAINWDSLAGYDDVKLEIEDTVVLALQNPELYDEIARKTRCRYESNRPRAVLFEGPPGTGKTLSARIIAQQAGIPMIHIPIESVVSKWYGDSEKKMSAIFDACEKFDGAIIFIDEIDALTGDRSGGTMHEASRRILSVLLQKVEGFHSAKKTTVICATNRKQDLDSALISRFDLCIRYDLPNQTTRRAVFSRYAKQLSTEDVEQLAVISGGLSCRDIKEICEYAERKWASKVLKKEVAHHLPPVAMYVDATKIHTLGVRSGSRGQPDDVYEA